jgi:hypothetical protein
MKNFKVFFCLTLLKCFQDMPAFPSYKGSIKKKGEHMALLKSHRQGKTDVVGETPLRTPQMSHGLGWD